MSEKYKYEIELSFNLGEAVSEVKEVENTLNSALATFGVKEQATIRSNGLVLYLNCDREMKATEVKLMKALLIDQFSKHLPTWKFELESFQLVPAGQPCSNPA